MHQAAVVFLVFAGQHRDQRGLEVVERDVGDEAEPAPVDADQRDAEGRELPADAEHGAVAADHQAEVALLADLLDREGFVAVAGGQGLGRFVVAARLFDVDLAALGFEKTRDAFHHAVALAAPGSGSLVFADQRDVTKGRGHGYKLQH